MQTADLPIAAERLASWLLPQLDFLLAQPEQVWLLHGAAGLGQYELAKALAQALLCEKPRQPAAVACGICSGCKLFQAGTHPDYLAVVPEQLALTLGIELPVKTSQELASGKRKASQEIKIEAIRRAIEFSALTTARATVKVILIYPAEQMNIVTANALLKTLEEPPPAVRFILVAQASQKLLPTIKSRCIQYALKFPTPQQSSDWLSQQLPTLLPQIAMALKISSNYPMRAFELLQSAAGRELIDAWPSIPQQLQSNNLTLKLTAQQWLECMQKVCYDLWLINAQVAPVYFSASDLPTKVSQLELANWSNWLKQQRKYATRAYNQNLFMDSLLAKAQQVLAPRR